MNSRLLSLSLLLLCQVIGLSNVRGADKIVDPAVLEQLRTVALREWQTAEREFGSIDVTFSFACREGLGDTAKLTNRQTFRLAWDPQRVCKLLRTQRDGGSDGMAHDVFNPRYDFEVSCPDLHARGTLAKLHIPSQSESPRESRLPMADLHLRTLHTRSHCFASPLREFLNTQEFEPIEAVLFQDAAGELIRFTAKYLGARTRHRHEHGIYTIIVDPAHHYRLCGNFLDYKTGSDESRISYYAADDILTPKEIHCIYKYNNGSGSSQLYTIDIPKPCTIPDAEFYLPHYGFSETVLETLHPNPWPRWLLIGFGIVTIAIGAWLVRGRRQPAA